jgi:hypothetical protein
MTRAEDSRTPAISSANKDAAPTSRGQLARRLSGWAGNLLATAIVLAAGLTFGRQVLLWWRADAARPVPPVVAPPLLGDEASLQQFEFGDYPFLLQRESLAGDRRAVLDRLSARCRDMAEAAPRIDRAAGPAELAMLRRLEGKPPTAVGKRWQLHELERPLPLVAATTEWISPDSTGPRRRVVSWGLALPVLGVPAAGDAAAGSKRGANQSWTLFTWSAADAQSPVGQAPAQARTPPIPAGARRTMLLAAEDGSALVAFRGGGAPQDAIEFYNNYFAQAASNDAPSKAIWREIDGVWHARFEQANSTIVDVQLALAADGVLNGVLTLAPIAEHTRE